MGSCPSLQKTTLEEEPMPNTVRDWMSKPVIVVDPDSSVKYTLTLMRRRKIHSVVVAISEKNPT